MFYDRKTLKLQARASLRGVHPRPWVVTLLSWLLVSLIPAVITLIIQFASGSGIFAYLQELTNDPVGWSARMEAMDVTEMLEYYGDIFGSTMGAGLIASFVSILISLFQQVISYGYTNYTLKLYRGEETETGDIFSGFPVATRAIGAGIMTFIFEFLWTLLAVTVGACATMIIAVATFALGVSAAVVTLGALLLIAVWIAVILFAIFISYRYSLVPYFILTTDMGVMDAIRASREHMRGNLRRRFVLELSFIGWELLNGLIAMGVVLIGIALIGTVVAPALFQVMWDTDLLYFESRAYIGQFISQMVIGMGILAVVATVATLPISLWLTAYRGSAYAGFFLAVTGQDAQPQAVRPTDHIPPQPSDIWDQVPPPPAFTSPTAPKVPAEPVEEIPTAEDPVTPEVPLMEPEAVADTPDRAEVPAEPAAEAPAEPESPAEGPQTEE